MAAFILLVLTDLPYPFPFLEAPPQQGATATILHLAVFFPRILSALYIQFLKLLAVINISLRLTFIQLFDCKGLTSAVLLSWFACFFSLQRASLFRCMMNSMKRLDGIKAPTIKRNCFYTKVFGIIHTLLIHTSAVVVCIETLGFIEFIEVY